MTGEIGYRELAALGGVAKEGSGGGWPGDKEDEPNESAEDR